MKFRSKFQFLVFVYWYTMVLAAFGEKNVLPQWIHFALLSKFSWSYMQGAISVFFIMLRWSICLFLYQNHSLYSCICILNLKLDRVILPNLFLFYKIALAIPVPLLFLLESCLYLKNPDTNCIISIYLLRRINIGGLLSLPNHKQGMLLHLFRSSLISFIRICF